MKLLFDILNGIPNLEISGADARTLQIPAIRFDSRRVHPGDLFVAVKGVSADGHAHIGAALEKGAIAVMFEQWPADLARPEGVCLIQAPDSAEALGWVSDRYFDNPSAHMQVVGVTGTNGKTTITTLLWQLFTQMGYKCGLIGTIENRVGEERIPATHTTPDAVRLHETLAAMRDAGCTYVFMEVSSHAVHQRRIAGVHFRGGVFSNLTHDHLDYHGTFAAYRDAKKMFFDHLPANAFALTNADDRNGDYMLQNTRAEKRSYGLKNAADFKGKILENSLSGLHLQVDGAVFHARMIGEFNASNLCAAFGVGRLLEQDKMELITVLSGLPGAEGRFECIVHPEKQCIGIVDYAHTPDAVEKVLETIQKLKKRHSRVITVIGCGGDRDTTKRPVMARTAAQFSDQVILTSDNPRTENPASILLDMENGLDEAAKMRTLTIENREQAIKTACQLAGKEDILLVAGKGHEKYQDIMGVKHPFDDKAMLEKYFKI
jgi:UDP-N-acetylmuramoyl-L-alanyl-D-glutamate--2,6-diaminopimelate ligase